MTFLILYAGLGNTSAPQSLKEYKCGFCDQIFQNKSDFKNCRKRHHIEFTSPCRDYIIGCCRYKQGCLYKHEGLNEVSNIESSDMIRFFKIMEKFTERMKQVENHLYNWTNSNWHIWTIQEENGISEFVQ